MLSQSERRTKAIGISAMMHGYLAFDENGELLVPFRTWRNTITQGAADELTDVFQYNIPQRWSIAHLYQAILNQEPHVSKVRFITTLSGYLHWKLTGERVLGIGDAAGMFPIDSSIRDYHPKMLSQFDELIRENEYPWKIEEILPKVLCAGEKAGTLTEAGARLLDESGTWNPDVSAGGRCRNRNDCNEQCDSAHRKCICRNVCVCHACTGKRIERCSS